MRLLYCLICVFLSANLLAQKKDTLIVQTGDTIQFVFGKIEVEASVDRRQWIDRLTKKPLAPIEKAKRKGQKAGTYTVQVKFLLEKDGSITDVQALNDPGYGLAKAAETIFKKSLGAGPKWKPGISNDKAVRSYHTQPITFVIQKM